MFHLQVLLLWFTKKEKLVLFGLNIWLFNDKLFLSKECFIKLNYSFLLVFGLGDFFFLISSFIL
ncbi:hypothetical protein BFG04_02280 [Campylobacter pinnipediorum subsp. pinnipediorum]|uniref:Uncharacterized protein n=1 Tax=Campylobacter pinnipediorum subsp. pinnipediorum TaxID=1660067 RepID=A0AAX0LBB9_9BACT|nr:hypothetical protein BFG04_02280 [Campylobacter pinnipediorum subsp. pinnipediorum]